MSRFSYDRIRPRSFRDVDRVNGIYTALVDASDPVMGDNLAEEGLDALAFSQRPHARLKVITDNTRVGLAPSAVFLTFPMGVAFRTSAIGAVSSKDALRLTSIVWFESLPAGGATFAGIPANALVEMKHQKRDNGVTSVIPASYGKLKAGPGGGSALGLDGTLPLESWITGGAVNLEWVELIYKLSGAVNAQPSKAILVVDVFRSTRVL